MVTGFVSSVVMKHPMRKSCTGELTVYPPPALSFWTQWKPSLTNSAGRDQALDGTVVLKRTSLFHCCVHLSFNELIPVELLGPLSLIKGSRTFLGGSQGICLPGPQHRDPAQAHNSGCLASTSFREFPADGEATPSLSSEIYMCLPSRLFLLT